MSGKVLVLGEDTRAFLAVVRSLGRRGLEVHAAWCPPNVPAAHSRYIRRRHRVPAYQPEGDTSIETLKGILEQNRFDLVIPCHDGAALALQQHRARLEPSGRLYLLEDRAFEISFSKEKTYELARDLGVPVPEQCVAGSRAALETLVREWGYPLVVKPRTSASARNPWARRPVRKLWNGSDLAAASGRLEAGRQVLFAQRNFPGRGVGIEVLCRDGAILTALQHERVHEPLMGGGSSYRRTVPLDPELLDATARLLCALGYTGVAMVEFKAGAGGFALMEINGRFWGSLPLAIAAGLDFPWFLYQMLCEGRTEFPRAYRENLYCRNWLLDLYWMKANATADRSNPALMTVPSRQVARELLNIPLLRECNDTFTLDDPRPAIAEFRELAAGKLDRGLRRLPSVRRRMRARALAAARPALFLCKGNICRSPFAELAFGRGVGYSAGYYPVPGRPAPWVAAEAARRFGIDLGPHRSRVLTDEMVAAAGAIFIFDREQEEFLRQNYPARMNCVHYLGALDPGGPLEIEDPYGEDLAVFLETYSRIQWLLSGLA